MSLWAGHYEPTAERRGYANGTKPKQIDTPAGTVDVEVPKTVGHDGVPFYPQSLERGDGTRWEAPLYRSVAIADMAPIVVEQMRRAGFSVQLMETSTQESKQAMYNCRKPMVLWGHHGEIYDPHDAMLGYHGDFYAPAG